MIGNSSSVERGIASTLISSSTPDAVVHFSPSNHSTARTISRPWCRDWTRQSPVPCHGCAFGLSLYPSINLFCCLRPTAMCRTRTHRYSCHNIGKSLRPCFTRRICSALGRGMFTRRSLFLPLDRQMLPL
jgi:hypothetical protein